MLTISSSERKKDKYKDLPPELKEQWAADRAKKAENKRKRALARLEAAADPLVKKKGGKKKAAEEEDDGKGVFKFEYASSGRSKCKCTSTV